MSEKQFLDIFFVMSFVREMYFRWGSWHTMKHAVVPLSEQTYLIINFGRDALSPAYLDYLRSYYRKIIFFHIHLNHSLFSNISLWIPPPHHTSRSWYALAHQLGLFVSALYSLVRRLIFSRWSDSMITPWICWFFYRGESPRTSQCFLIDMVRQIPVPGW